MKQLTWLITFIIAYVIHQILNSLGIAPSLGLLISPDDLDRAYLIAGAFSGLFAVVIYGLAFFTAKKINGNREVVKFHKDVVNSGLSAFEYAKSITPSEVIAFCDQHLDGPVYVVTAKIDQLPDNKIISRPCADALIEGYTKLMQ